MQPQQDNEQEDILEERVVTDTTILSDDAIIIEHTETIPTKKPLLTLPAAILTGLALIALAVMLSGSNLKKTVTNDAATNGAPETPTSIPSDIAKLKSDDHVRGGTSAEVIVIEYSDSDCPYCVKFHPTLKSVVDDYKGRVSWVYRYFPLDMHPNAYTEAVSLECVARVGGENAFWKYLDTVVNVTLNADPKSNEALVSFAQAQGVPVDSFKKCFADPSVSAKIDADIKEAGVIGARGTPFSIAVNQKTGKQVVIPGAYPLDQVKQMIDSIL